MSLEKAHFTGSAGEQLFYRLWQPAMEARALIVIVHGAAEHSGRYQRFAENFTALGYAVASLDLPGHGESAGRRGHIRRFAEYLDAVDTFAGLLDGRFETTPQVLLGHSMGGLIAARYLLDGPDAFAACALSAPAIATDLTPPDWQLGIIRGLSVLWPTLGVLQLDAAGISRDLSEVQIYLDDPKIYRGKLSARLVWELFATMAEVQKRAEELTLPLLCLHGDADVLTAHSGSVLLHERACSKDKTLKLYPGLYHEIFNEPERASVFADLAAWLNTRLDRRSTEGNHARRQGD
ncbi:MAG: lysophospholipase [Pseudomonadota bacterium]